MKGLLLGTSLFLTSVALNMAIPLPEPNPNPNIGWLYNLIPLQIFKPNDNEELKVVEVKVDSLSETPTDVIDDAIQPIPVFTPAIAPYAAAVPENLETESKVAELDAAVAATNDEAGQPVAVLTPAIAPYTAAVLEPVEEANLEAESTIAELDAAVAVTDEDSKSTAEGLKVDEGGALVVVEVEDTVNSGPPLEGEIEQVPERR